MQTTSILAVGSALAAVTLTACTHKGALRAEAAQDLGCPEDRLEVKPGGVYREVAGCGKRASYHYNGSVWVREGQATVDGATAGGAK